MRGEAGEEGLEHAPGSAAGRGTASARHVRRPSRRVPHLDPRTGDPITLQPTPEDALDIHVADLSDPQRPSPRAHEPIQIRVPPCPSATLPP